MKTKLLLSSLLLAGMLMMGTTPMQAQCHAGFTFNASASTVAFTNTSTGGTANTNYQWNFGDGNYAYGSASATHAYYNGTYVACLHMSDSSNTGAGCSSNFCDTIVITNGMNPPCSAYFSYSVDSMHQQGVAFRDYSANAPISWSWNFGDGNISTQQNPVHQYAQVGTYSVCLTIVDSFHDSCTYCTSVNYYPCNQVAGFTYNTANDPQINFTNTSTGGYAPYYYWNFGDGNSSYLLNATHTYQYKGTYNVCLTVYDSLSNGCQASHCDTIIITNGTNPPCSAYFSYAIDSMHQQGVTFHDYSANSPISWSWNFGDGNTSAQQNPVHQYAQAGTYTVCLAIVNSFHDSCTYCTSVNYYPCNQVAGFTYNTANDPQINFTNTSTGGYAPYYSWNFGDGNYLYSSLNATHTYQYNGTYNVCLTVYDSLSNGCYASQCSTIVITHASPQPCNAVFYSDSINTTTTSIGFHDASTGGATSWLWNFGDGTSSTLQNPVHQYVQSGTYSVCLTITTPAGTCSYCSTVLVGSISCSANVYVAQDSSNTNPLLWYVYSSVTGTAPFTYVWNFGDGTTSSQAYPTHTYATPGHYNICLTITDATGCTSSSCDSTYKVSSSGIIGSLVVVNALAGIEENSVSVNSVFPNPANDILSVSFNQMVKGDIRILDMTGREVYQVKISSNNVKINVSTLPVGCYNLSVVSGTKTIHSKLMIVR